MNAQRTLPIKVGICGTFSTGKSTLCERLRNSFSQILILDEPARDCPLPLNEEQTLETSAWLIGSHMRQEASATIDHSVLILSDRTPIDVAGHTMAISDKNCSNPSQIDSLLEICYQWSTTYDILLLSLLDSEIPIAKDKIRSRDEQFRLEIQINITNFINSRSVPHVVLPNDVQRRETLCVEKISALLGQ